MASTFNVEFPSMMTNIFKHINELVSFSLVDLPGFACLVAAGDSSSRFFGAHVLQLALMPVACAGVHVFYSLRIRQALNAAALTAPADASTHLRVSMKLRRATVKSVYTSSRSGLQFAIVYLLYPGCSKQIFSVFECRRIGDAYAIMAQDYGTICIDETGAFSATWLAYVISSIILTGSISDQYPSKCVGRIYSVLFPHLLSSPAYT